MDNNMIQAANAIQDGFIQRDAIRESRTLNTAYVPLGTIRNSDVVLKVTRQPLTDMTHRVNFDVVDAIPHAYAIDFIYSNKPTRRVGVVGVGSESGKAYKLVSGNTQIAGTHNATANRSVQQAEIDNLAALLTGTIKAVDADGVNDKSHFAVGDVPRWHDDSTVTFHADVSSQPITG